MTFITVYILAVIMLNRQFDNTSYITNIMHSSNCIFIYFELIINNIPLPNLHHAIFPIILGFIYNTFFQIMLAIYPNSESPYPFLDYSKDINATMIPINTILLFILYAVSYGFKNYFVESRCRSNKNVENKLLDDGENELTEYQSIQQ